MFLSTHCPLTHKGKQWSLVLNHRPRVLLGEGLSEPHSLPGPEASWPCSTQVGQALGSIGTHSVELSVFARMWACGVAPAQQTPKPMQETAWRAGVEGWSKKDRELGGMDNSVVTAGGGGAKGG